MESSNCDFSPLKQQLKQELRQVMLKIQQSIDSMDNENYCLLGHFKQIKDAFTEIETSAASFYLMCYLNPYTDKYLDLTVSLKNLGERRHGAIIVVERNDPLEIAIQPGILINAEMTSPLLESIFFPGSPLHDGAVWIKKNQIYSAANLLPLTHRPPGRSKLGTRHRAALGITEKTDAMALVVSEETGKTSFALNGRLYPIQSGEYLQ